MKKKAELPNRISIGISPCPNDCFIFDAMVHNKIDTEGLVFDLVMEDVEALNKKAFNEELDITKLSFFAIAHLLKNYQLLDAGSALGKGCGPLLIGKSDMVIDKNTRIAIPGKYTTANFLLSIAFPSASNKVEMLFSDIEDAVINNNVEAGLIIHENRFTYEEKGLKKIMDLGEYWEGLTKGPIPLGGIALRRNLSEELKQKINRVLKKSVEFAFENPESSLNFVKQHAQEMSEVVMKKHIALYVNDYSIDLGTAGKKAIELLFERAKGLGLIEKTEEKIFIN